MLPGSSYCSEAVTREGICEIRREFARQNPMSIIIRKAGRDDVPALAAMAGERLFSWPIAGAG